MKQFKTFLFNALAVGFVFCVFSKNQIFCEEELLESTAGNVESTASNAESSADIAVNTDDASTEIVETKGDTENVSAYDEAPLSSMFGTFSTGSLFYVNGPAKSISESGLSGGLSFMKMFTPVDDKISKELAGVDPKNPLKVFFTTYSIFNTIAKFETLNKGLSSGVTIPSLVIGYIMDLENAADSKKHMAPGISSSASIFLNLVPSEQQKILDASLAVPQEKLHLKDDFLSQHLKFTQTWVDKLNENIIKVNQSDVQDFGDTMVQLLKIFDSTGNFFESMLSQIRDTVVITKAAVLTMNDVDVGLDVVKSGQALAVLLEETLPELDDKEKYVDTLALVKIALKQKEIQLLEAKLASTEDNAEGPLPDEIQSENEENIN